MSSSTRSSVLGLASSLVIIMANLGSGVITARLLGPEGRAVVITATVWLIVSSWVALVGTRQSVQFYLAPERDRPTLASTAGSALILVTALAGLGTALSQLVVGYVIRDPALLGPTRVTLTVVVVVVWYEVVSGILLGRHRVGVALVVRTSQAVLYVVLVGGAAVLDVLSAGVALMCLVGSFLLPALVGLTLVVTMRGLGRPRLLEMGRLLRYGARVYPGSLATLTNARIDLLVVPAVLTPLAVGHYGVASNTSSVLQQLLGNFALVLFPALVAGDPSARRRLLERAIRLVLVIGLVGAGVGALVAGPVIRFLYGADFDATVPLLRILLLAAVPYALMGILASGLAANAMPWRASLVNVVGVPATVAGLLVLVPVLGAEGAALTSLIAYGLCLLSGLTLSPPTLLRVRSILAPRAYVKDVRDLGTKARLRRFRNPK